ncbi:MAG TPA: hypothetical protein PK303_08290 [bacterium]|nr:hypothetical protein [bacterium]HOL35475.1 hypothetical protein [bacterium]HPP09102.1 hypothetical protein [bacterium]
MKNTVFGTLEKWWNQENDKPLIDICIVKEKNFISLNDFWKDQNQIDFEKVVDSQVKNAKKLEYVGISHPALLHQWGTRGTPMTMCAYLGCDVIFGKDTIWYEKFVDNWEKTKIRFDEKNQYVQMSKNLMEKQVEKVEEGFVIKMPDFGDALTCFSLMRGVENLLLDIVEIPEVIKEKIDEFIDAWIDAHRFFHRIYSKKIPGDASWLLWAPGRTYACQSDFSTMISPRMFEEFVVYELEKIKDYLQYIVWHLDGPDEIKHLDILLSLPYIRAIQVTPGAGRPPCASDLWMPQIQKILEKGKNVILYAKTKEEFETLIKNFPSGNVIIACLSIDMSPDKDSEFLNVVEPYL